MLGLARWRPDEKRAFFQQLAHIIRMFRIVRNMFFPSMSAFRSRFSVGYKICLRFTVFVMSTSVVLSEISTSLCRLSNRLRLRLSYESVFDPKTG